MLQVDRNDPVTSLILQLPSYPEGLILVVLSPYENRTISVPLPVPDPLYPERHGVYILDTFLFDELPEGFSDYTVVSTEGENMDEGLLNIINTADTSDLKTAPDSNDDYKVYENE